MADPFHLFGLEVVGHKSISHGHEYHMQFYLALFKLPDKPPLSHATPHFPQKMI